MILNINGTDYTISDEYKSKTLVYILREKLGLMGTKKGCGTNDCGACKVIVDGKALNSCVLIAKNQIGKRIVTIEGLSDGVHPHPIQQAFVDAGAVQCGFCTPGMIMTAKALLDSNHAPTDKEIREAMGDNICRCTGYVKIIDAVKLAAKLLYGNEAE